MSSFQTVTTPDCDGVPSILMTVGREHYKLHSLISEYSQQGVSKRIPKTAIPDGLVPQVSKIFIAHPDAILRVTVNGKTLNDLVVALVNLKVLTQVQIDEMEDLDKPYWSQNELNPYDFVPPNMLTISSALSTLSNPERAKVEDEFGIEYCMGIIGFAHVSSIQYVTKPDDDGLPDDLKHLEGYVTPVRVIHDEDEEEICQR